MTADEFINELQATYHSQSDWVLAFLENEDDEGNKMQMIRLRPKGDDHFINARCPINWLAHMKTKHETFVSWEIWEAAHYLGLMKNESMTYDLIDAIDERGTCDRKLRQRIIRALNSN